jgi:hypothetical protein
MRLSSFEARAEQQTQAQQSSQQLQLRAMEFAAVLTLSSS